MTFATGKYSQSICDRCGFQYPYTAMQLEQDTNVFVCPECDDGMWNRVGHPQNHLPKNLVDGMALRNARPTKNLVTDTVAEFAQDKAPEEIVDYIQLFVLSP